MKYRLPLVIERAVRGAESARRIAAEDFETQLRKQLIDEQQGITCTKGCHSCCYYPVMVSVLEGVSLFRWLSDHGLWRKQLKDRFEQTHRNVWGLSPSVWMLSMTPCPLLEEAGTCMAYEARPFVCRTTVSLRDPYNCHPHRFTAGEVGLVSRKAADQRLHEAENPLLKSAGLTLLRLPLSTAVLVGERLCKEGLAPEEVSEQLFEDWVRNC